jgi:hypothetical protein
MDTANIAGYEVAGDYIIYIMGAVYTTVVPKYKVDTTTPAFVYCLSTLHVSTLMLGHHQAYKNTKLRLNSIWIHIVFI